jgi:hypothetical protein
MLDGMVTVGEAPEINVDALADALMNVFLRGALVGVPK